MGNHQPLHLAANEGHVDCVKELIQAGADVSTDDGNGDTPLKVAARNFSFDCVSTLLEVGAEANTTHLALMAMVTSIIPLQNSEGTVQNTYH